MNKQWQFPGGIALNSHKLLSEISESTLPSELIYPLFLRSDCYATPFVHQGQRVLKGEVIASSQNPFATPIHAASSGIIKAIAPRIIAHPSGLADTCIIIETDGLNEACHATPCLNYQLEAPETLSNKIAQAGIVGLGGAAFPTAVKLQTQRTIRTLIINGAECEPYISCDVSLMQTCAQQVVQGALIMQYILHAERCIIAIENTMQIAQLALLKAASQQNLEILTVPAIYPTGGEKQLIEVLTGIQIPPSLLPAEYGFICQNVGTAYAVYQAIFLGMPLTERIITVTGKGIKQAKNIRAKIGTPIKHLVEQCGGYTQDVQRLIMGGSMMGFALSSDDIAVIKATNCLLAMTASDLAESQSAVPCIRCGNCATVCPTELLPQQLYWYSRSKQYEQCLDYQLFDCIECGCCDIVCPSHIPLVQSFRAAKGELIIKEKHLAQANLAKNRYQNQQQRRAKEEQEKLAKTEKRQAAIDKMKAAAAERKKV
ncbi:electron transporter RnfC [Methyloprofundus sedimenti]|uniref:Ion-translocating oxidoreductase complex subunit C n=1 Tax=Methyloprofundus sedimenti TaxID=1420851 RepID=A0A1V8M511_9GAMM|nr:electron transport complex subunit RsxC [Methyloprofundus sedimenti]OQK16645.1 electron transporter RnfC [Methyloprofundus sedimenti]